MAVQQPLTDEELDAMEHAAKVAREECSACEFNHEHPEHEPAEAVPRLVAEVRRLRGILDEAAKGPNSCNCEGYPNHPRFDACPIALWGRAREKAASRIDAREAVFQPKRRDNLRPHAVPWVGRRHRWRAMWTIEAGEIYAGQSAWVPVEPYPPGLTWMGWVPDEDLEDA